MFGFDISSALAGAAVAGLGYFGYLCATKGLPAAWSLVKARWNAGRAELASLSGEVDEAHTRIDSALESLKTIAQGLGQAQARLARLETAFNSHLAADAATAHPNQLNAARPAQPVAAAAPAVATGLATIALPPVSPVAEG